jgi:TRAP-type mannitol/chloroaromatic compound transport system permease small subunit
MRFLLKLADRLESVPRICLHVAAWMMVPMVCAIVFEVLTRRARVEVPMLTSVRLLELQWHFHVTLFMFCLGYGYLRNVHVRIDMAVSRTTARTRGWIELIGLLTLFFPFVVMLLYWGYVYWSASYALNEYSDNTEGLPYRWLIKPVMPIGAAMLLIAGTCNALRLIVFLFGTRELANEAKPVIAQ